LIKRKGYVRQKRMANLSVCLTAKFVIAEKMAGFIEIFVLA